MPENEKQIDDTNLLEDAMKTDLDSENTAREGEVPGVGQIGGGFVSGGISMTYRSTVLRKWSPAPTVKEVKDNQGEMGRAVKLPADLKELAKSKFKENQFNLVASDMISLNRSLTDVRYEM